MAALKLPSLDYVRKKGHNTRPNSDQDYEVALQNLGEVVIAGNDQRTRVDDVSQFPYNCIAYMEMKFGPKRARQGCFFVHLDPKLN